MFVKVCGITRPEDALHAIGCGATAVGFVFWPKSPRLVTTEQARAIVALLPPDVITVGVFVDEPLDAIRATVAASGVTMVQLHGDEPASYGASLAWPVLKAIAHTATDQAMLEWPDETTFLIDAYDPVRRGGTGTTADWTRAASLARRRRIVLAGGLTPANVAEAIGQVQPFGVDVSSGVESAPGHQGPRQGDGVSLERAGRVRPWRSDVGPPSGGSKTRIEKWQRPIRLTRHDSDGATLTRAAISATMADDSCPRRWLRRSRS